MTKVSIIVSHESKKMLTTIAEVRDKAAFAFAGSTESFWQLFVGESVDDYVFLSGQAAWAEQCKIMLMQSALSDHTIYARQVCIRSASAHHLPLHWWAAALAMHVH